MLRAVVKKEMLGHLVSFRFLISTLIMVVLAALAAFVGTQDYSLRARSYEAQLEQQRQELAKVHVYSRLKPVVTRAPEPLSVFDRGFDARLGIAVELDVFEVPARATGRHRGDELIASARDLDLTTMIRLVLGLLALLMTFDAVSGERERGTLRLIFANGVSRSVLLAGKFVGAFVTLLIPLAASLALSVWILLAMGDVVLGVERWLRLAGLAGAYVVYLGAMLLLGLLLSVLTRTSSASLVYALLSWLLIVFLIPQTAVAVASAAAHADEGRRSAVSAVGELETARDRLLGEMEERQVEAVTEVYQRAPVVVAEGRGARYRYGTAAYYDARSRFHRAEVEVGMDYADRIFEVRRLDRQAQQRFENLVRILSFPSPAFLLERLSESLTGTSVDDHEAFLESCRAYRTEFLDYLRNHRAFASWRWFTDDDPATLAPWTSVAGFPPEAAPATASEQMIERFQGAEVQRRIQRDEKRWAADPKRLLALDDLPRPQPPTLRLPRAVSRVGSELFAMLLEGGLLAVFGLRRFRCYSMI